MENCLQSSWLDIFWLLLGAISGNHEKHWDLGFIFKKTLIGFTDVLVVESERERVIEESRKPPIFFS